jgi:hypothetical protein
MTAWVGLDCGKNLTNVCIIGERGEIVAEGVVDPAPHATRR